MPERQALSADTVDIRADQGNPAVVDPADVAPADVAPVVMTNLVGTGFADGASVGAELIGVTAALATGLATPASPVLEINIKIAASRR